MAHIDFDQDYQALIARRRDQILARVERAARASGRDPAQVKIVAVSKTVDVPHVAAAYEAGWRLFGENRPQELSRKVALVSQDPALAQAQFHMIGNLQTNKINLVLDSEPALIHSISSQRLAQAVAKRAQARGTQVAVLLEVNVSGEQSKSGMTASEVRQAVAQICALPGLDVRGLMTMAPRDNPAIARDTFRGLRALKEELSEASAEVARHMSELSMGMSDDFEEGIAQGATIIRLGRVVFDPDYVLQD